MTISVFFENEIVILFYLEQFSLKIAIIKSKCKIIDIMFLYLIRMYIFLLSNVSIFTIREHDKVILLYNIRYLFWLYLANRQILFINIIKI